MPEHPQPPTPWTSPRRRKLQLLAMGLVLLLSGVVIGASGAIVVVRHLALTVVQDLDTVPTFLERRFTRTLDLDAEQQRQMKAILDKHHEAFLELRRENRPKIDALIESLDDEIGAILTEDQRAEWRERFETFLETWQPRLPEAS